MTLIYTYFTKKFIVFHKERSIINYLILTDSNLIDNTKLQYNDIINY